MDSVQCQQPEISSPYFCHEPGDNNYQRGSSDQICSPQEYNLSSVNVDPEFNVIREQFQRRLSFATADPKLVKQGENVPKKRISLYEYHKLHPFSTDPHCNDLEIPISQEEFEFLCSEIPDPMWNSTFCLERIRRIFCNVPESAGNGTLLEKRVLELYKFYLIKSPAGVFIQDINTFKDILFVANELIDWFPFLKEFGVSLLKQLKQGFRIQNLSHAADTACLDGLTQLFTDFGVLIRGCPSVLAGHTIDLVEHWLQSYDQSVQSFAIKSGDKKNPPQSTSCAVPVPTDKRLDSHLFFSCLEDSQLAPRLIQFIIEAPNANPCHVEFYVNVLGLLTKLIDCSHEIRDVALAFPIIEPMLLQLKQRDEGCKLLKRTVEIIYALLARPTEDMNEIKIVAPCSSQAFEVLLFRFLQRLRHVTSKLLINLRNDVAFVIYLLTKQIPVLRCNFGRHASIIAGIVANNVMSQENIQFVLDSTVEDLELVRILLWTLHLIVDSSEKHAPEIIEKYELVSVLIRILIGPCSMLDCYEEDEGILQQVVQSAWSLFICIARKWPEALLIEEGVDAILKVLKIYAKFGQLELGTVTILMDILRTLLSNEVKQEEIVSYLINKDATLVLTGVFSQVVKKELEIADEPMICACLICCSICANYDQTQREIFLQENGVKVLTLLIYEIIYNPAHKKHLNPFVQICITECIWKTLASSLESLEMFFAYEGIFRMLDLLEISAGPAPQIHILNCLVELCEYNRCVGQLLHWKRRSKTASKRQCHSDEFQVPGSRNGVQSVPEAGDGFGDIILDHDMTLAALLCELWRSEETRFGCARDKRGIIAAFDTPLMSIFAQEFNSRRGKKSSGLGLLSESSSTSDTSNGPSCLDLVVSIRPKIYLLVKRIVETTNTEATLFGSLSLHNQLTMQIIINFLDLKRGEIWLEMIQELQSEGIRLVDSDYVMLKRFLKISHNKVCAVIGTQRYLTHRSQEHDEIQERQLYSVIQQCHFQNHLDAIKEADFFARTSNYSLLLEKRLWQKTQLAQAVGNVAQNARITRTTDDSLNITVWPGRNKVVITEPQLDKFEGEEEQLKPVKQSDISRMSIASSIFSVSGSVALGSGGTALDEKLYPTLFATLGDTARLPGSNEEGFYEVAPATLQKALLAVALEQKKWDWSELDDDKAWKMRTKWKNEWYP